MPATRTPVDDLVKWLDPPKGGLWHGGASTTGCLRGVTAEAAAWKADRALLRKTHRALIEVVRDFPPDRLNQSSGATGAWTFMDLISGVVLHDAYHTGQIQLMKRLHRSLHPNT